MYLIYDENKNIVGVSESISNIRKAIQEYFIVNSMFLYPDISKIVIEYKYHIEDDEYELRLSYKNDHVSYFKAVKVKKY